MKKYLLLPLVIFALGLTSCGETPTSKVDPTTGEPTTVEPTTGEPTTGESTTAEPTSASGGGDGYEYKLPDKAEDGVVLQAFNWSFKEIEAELPYIAESGFKIVQTSPIQQPKSGGSSWWSFYQPLSFSIADNSPLGTKQDLKSLCETADQYGVKIICDIVFNHLANINDNELEPDGTPKVSPEVAKYEPEIYNLRNDTSGNNTFHHNKNAQGSGAVTQYYAYGALPDLNTANSLVQQRSLALLKEAIDVGVDGFRFDAAKHIETPDDPQYASDFWPNVLGAASQYYKDKTGDNLFAYGEILAEVGGGRQISYYTKYMKVTENNYVTNIASGVSGKNADRMLNAAYGKGNIPQYLVPWVESHDTYVEESSHSSNTKVARMWAAIAARKDTNPMYLARPDSANTVGVAADIFCEEQQISVANRFHNRFVGANENIFVDDLQTVKSSQVNTAYVVERYTNKDAGALVICVNTQTSTTIHFQHLPDGTYFDQMTGNSYVISGGVANITNVDSSGIICLTKTAGGPHPFVEISEREGTFVGTKVLTLTPKYCTSATYSINGGSPVSFSAKTEVTIGNNVDAEGKIHLLLKADNDPYSFERNYTYSKATIISGYFNVFNFNSSYYDTFEIYFWVWGGSYNGQWLEAWYKVENGVMLIDMSGKNFANFLIALFEKGHKITNVNAWDNACLKQTKDIAVSTGYYDASAL